MINFIVSTFQLKIISCGILFENLMVQQGYKHKVYLDIYSSLCIFGWRQIDFLLLLLFLQLEAFFFWFSERVWTQIVLQVLSADKFYQQLKFLWVNSQLWNMTSNTDFIIASKNFLFKCFIYVIFQRNFSLNKFVFSCQYDFLFLP